MFADDVGADRLNRDAALEDLQFFVGQQWDDTVVARRQAQKKPVMTINRLPAFVAQILGSRRLNETDIKIAADTGGEVPVAQVREGLIRNVQKVSKADFAYDTALAGAVCCGIGNFKLDLEYSADNPRGQQDMKVNAIPDHLAVIWDRNMQDQTGDDATRCFLVELDEPSRFLSGMALGSAVGRAARLQHARRSAHDRLDFEQRRSRCRVLAHA